MKQNCNIIFMGTPDFAVPALEALHRNNAAIRLVVTQPDRPKGRGRNLFPTPVKKAAMDMGYPVTQPLSVKEDNFIETVSRLKPDFLVVVAFGQILPEKLLAVPAVAPVNIHASILPRYRGPAPIQWAIINGETETGVTTMFMDKGLDTGDILLSATEPVSPDDTYESLHDRLAIIGGDILIKTLNGLVKGNVKPVPQRHSDATYAPLLKKQDGRINWNQPAEKIDAFIRGMMPWPGAHTFFNGKMLKIFKATRTPLNAPARPGTVISGFENELRIATGSGALSIEEIQGASGKRLLIRDFLRGAAIPTGAFLE